MCCLERGVPRVLRCPTRTCVSTSVPRTESSSHDVRRAAHAERPCRVASERDRRRHRRSRGSRQRDPERPREPGRDRDVAQCRHRRDGALAARAGLVGVQRRARRDRAHASGGTRRAARQRGARRRHLGARSSRRCAAAGGCARRGSGSPEARAGGPRRAGVGLRPAGSGRARADPSVRVPVRREGGVHRPRPRGPRPRDQPARRLRRAHPFGGVPRPCRSGDRRRGAVRTTAAGSRPHVRGAGHGWRTDSVGTCADPVPLAHGPRRCWP